MQEAANKYLQLEIELLSTRARGELSEAEEEALQEAMEDLWLQMSDEERDQANARAENLLDDREIVGFEGSVDITECGFALPIIHAKRVGLTFSHDTSRKPATRFFPSEILSNQPKSVTITRIAEPEPLPTGADQSQILILFASNAFLDLLRAEIFTKGLKEIGTVPARFATMDRGTATKRVSRWRNQLEKLLMLEVSRAKPDKNEVVRLSKAILSCLLVTGDRKSDDAAYQPLIFGAEVAPELGAVVTRAAMVAIGLDRTNKIQIAVRSIFTDRATLGRRRLARWNVPVHV